MLVGTVAGPLLVAAMWAIGVGIGRYIGFVAACALLPIIAIALGAACARFTGATVAILATLLSFAAGLGAADQYDNIRLVESGDLVRHVPLAELPRHADKKRVTLASAAERFDLEETTFMSHRSGGASERRTTTYECTAFPIVPEDWQPTTPVRAWRFGDSESPSSDERIYKPGSPDELCTKAIHKCETAHHLTTAPDAIYLEAKVGDSPDVDANERNALFGLAFLSGLWVVTALLIAFKNAIAIPERRR